MLNQISFFVIIIIGIIFFASCSKDSIAIGLELPSNQIEMTVGERSTSVEIFVQEVSSSEVGGQLTVNFSANYDFTEAILESTQHLNFVDPNNNLSTLTFQVDSFTGLNGDLQVVFAVGTNNLAGLNMTGAQEVIIEDLHIE